MIIPCEISGFFLALLALLPFIVAWTSTQTPCSKPLVLLDRDGTINEDVGSPGVVRKNQLKLIPGAAAAIGNLNRAGLAVALVTNQSCVGKGLISKMELDDIHKLLRELLFQEDRDAKIKAIYTCFSVEPSWRKKPEPGMLLEAINDFGARADNCVFVGDTVSDMKAAAKIGAKGFLVSTGYGASAQEAVLQAIPDANIHMVRDLEDAVNEILGKISSDGESPSGPLNTPSLEK